MDKEFSFDDQQPSQGLRILCTLTFIYSGLVGFFALLGMLFAKSFFSMLEENMGTLASNPGISSDQIEQIQKLVEMGSGKFIIACGIYLLIIGLSFFGALQMWQNKYKGFVMYVIANSCFLISNVVSLNVFMSLLDALFIVLYFRNSKTLKKL